MVCHCALNLAPPTYVYIEMERLETLLLCNEPF